MRSTLRGFRAAVVVALVPAGLLLAVGGSASADVITTARADGNAESFGVLGPVGLVAVALGIVGMTLGVLRQRRKTRLAEAAPAVPEVPDPVTALAEAVLGEPDATPTRPFLTSRPNA
ncbi:hypothetical protein [Amycolatopsis sp. NPDC051128]|uniref:hypothetical protein n=1 Tax=Amycolatopsis sp. NPDC051128 TaxID=3155412 RepID=UPI00341B2C9F